ncbi:MAG: efflux transporter outer membrane subunit [Proteobacteria bacterium]|nr:efflux transporter outer membrane subunit [Pseudomonadota bacterium]
MLKERTSWLFLVAGLATLSACKMGPDYARPAAIVPATYKEIDGWKLAEPQDAASRGPWWSVFGDPLLDQLERQIEISNQNLKTAEAAFRVARAVVREAKAGFFPTVTLDGAAQRSGPVSGGAASSGSRVGTGRTGAGSSRQTLTEYDLTAGASWEPDVWGRIRRTVEGSLANAQASAADLASARLSAQTELASNYFALRVADELKRLLDSTVGAYTRSLEITRNRYASGVAARSDVVSAQAQLESTRAQAINVGVQRAQLEHAIALLMGKPPAEFSIAPIVFASEMPAIPMSLPSTLLERRPDIAAAERRVVTANAQIGVAEAVYFPNLTLSASFSGASTALGRVLQASNSIWTLGPQLAGTLFDGGLRNAQVEAARAGYDQSVAIYRQAVLTSFKQVEDQLAALQILARQAEVQSGAVLAAREAQQLILNQYVAGTVAYTSVITAQTTALGSEQAALTILESRLAASVSLIAALGGGWDASQLPLAE